MRVRGRERSGETGVGNIIPDKEDSTIARRRGVGARGARRRSIRVDNRVAGKRERNRRGELRFLDSNEGEIRGRQEVSEFRSLTPDTVTVPL